MDNEDVPHCKSLSEYAYHWSPDYVYRPRKCKEMQSLEIYHKDSGSVYIYTLLQDTRLWRDSGSSCSPAALDACAALDGVFEPEDFSEFDSVNGSCSCEVYDEYFAKNPEKMVVHFLHGYEVEIDSHGTSFQKGSTASTDISLLAKGQEEQIIAGEGIKTLFVSQKTGKPCEIGGRSAWSPSESTQGISGSLQELLDCAGFSLDEKSDLLRSHQEGESDAPHLRIGGVRILIHLSYENSESHRQDFAGQLCTATVSANPSWTSHVGLQNLDMPTPNRNQTMTLSRYGYGVLVSFEANGSISYFNLAGLNDVLLKMLVSLFMVQFLIEFIAYHAVGFESRLYDRAANEHLDPKNEVLGIVCRRASYMQAFHTLTRKYGGELDKQHFRDVMSSVFKHEVAAGTMSDKDLARFAAFAEYELFGGFGSQDYINAASWTRQCTSGEILTSEELGTLFDTDRVMKWGERFFGVFSMRRSPAFAQEPKRLQEAVAFYDDTSLQLRSLTERLKVLEATDAADAPRATQLPDSSKSVSEDEAAGSQSTVAASSDDYEVLAEIHRKSFETIESRMETWKVSFEIQAYRKIEQLEIQVQGLQNQIKLAEK
eukprot:CAMPEP_0197632832 /NCGR_PEP_ID=MMETSP1338-20131121/9390_1 /TAXON_ID=43686 ORGANISM="Pelagodinium beii, Strain RCC1491" /NCGR_SAMPLE_ID=MMETSP1338 /ASSEMBLY_ACC=CAM_ASM_000754 /LENGTH=598 /DNA_ID=CAMNT_0043204403 /DNA_START=285 /DNA_END=2081 /DNA_ORIENTATION=+